MATYYYISGETETDRNIYDTNKWSDSSGSNVPTSTMPTASDDFIIGSESAWAGTESAPIVLDAASEVPNSITSYGYVNMAMGDISALGTLNVTGHFKKTDGGVLGLIDGSRLNIAANSTVTGNGSFLCFTEYAFEINAAPSASIYVIMTYRISQSDLSAVSQRNVPDCYIDKFSIMIQPKQSSVSDLGADIVFGENTIINELTFRSLYASTTLNLWVTGTPAVLSNIYVTSAAVAKVAIRLMTDFNLELSGTNDQIVNLEGCTFSGDYKLRVKINKTAGNVSFFNVTADVIDNQPGVTVDYSDCFRATIANSLPIMLQPLQTARFRATLENDDRPAIASDFTEIKYSIFKSNCCVLGSSFFYNFYGTKTVVAGHDLISIPAAQAVVTPGEDNVNFEFEPDSRTNPAFPDVGIYLVRVIATPNVGNPIVFHYKVKVSYEF